MLSEMGDAPIEAIAMVRLIRYLKKIEQMEENRWPKVVLLSPNIGSLPLNWGILD
jgi:hypothetical protein